MKKIIKILTMTMTAAAVVITSSQAAQENSRFIRFFYSGDGHIRLNSNKNDKSFNGIYRDANGHYDEDAYRTIATVFGVKDQSSSRLISLRLIEFLDHIEDRLGKGALITITSGYRPPAYNANLRKRGALAAKASLHQYGMALDLIMAGVSSQRIWEYVKSLGFGGTGYYQGKTVHIDVGPTRYWDEKTSGVGTGLSDDNKLIGLVTDFDILAPGDTINLRFIRMTGFPIHIRPKFELMPVKPSSKDPAPSMVFKPKSAFLRDEACAEFANIDEMASFRWTLPANLPQGRYVISARFCDNKWEKMPELVTTPQFEVRFP